MKKLLVPIVGIGGLLACQPKQEHSKPSAAPDASKVGEETAVAPSVAALDPAQPDSLVGQPLEKVQAACDAAEVAHRVIERDGEPLPATMDYRPDRLNFTVKDGVIIGVTKG